MYIKLSFRTVTETLTKAITTNTTIAIPTISGGVYSSTVIQTSISTSIATTFVTITTGPTAVATLGPNQPTVVTVGSEIDAILQVLYWIIRLAIAFAALYLVFFDRRLIRELTATDTKIEGIADLPVLQTRPMPSS